MGNKYFLWLLFYCAYSVAMDPMIPKLVPKSSPRIQRIQGSPHSPKVEASPRQQRNLVPSLACLAARCLAQESVLLQDGALELITPKDQSCVREIILRELIKPHIFPLSITASQNKESVHHNGVCGLDFIPSTDEVVSGACDGKIVFCKKNSLASGIAYQFDQLYVSTLSILDTQPLEIFFGSDGGYIYRMSYETKKVEQHFKAHEGTINRICIGTNLIASSSIDKTVKLWNKKTTVLEGVLSGFKQSVRCIELLEDSHDVISGCSDGSLTLWDLDSKELVAEYSYPTDHRIWGLALLMDAKRIVTALNTRTLEGRLSLIDAERFKEVAQWYAHSHTISSLSCDENEKYCVTGSWAGNARLFDMRMRACAATFIGHRRWVTQVKCLGNEVVTGSLDNSLKLWDIRKIREIDTQELSKVVTIATRLKNKKTTFKEPHEREALLNELITKTN